MKGDENMKTLVCSFLMIVQMFSVTLAEEQKSSVNTQTLREITEMTESGKIDVIENPPKVEAVFVLDTTGSMRGLIKAAKEKIWAISNTLATAKPAPDIKIGLVGYRDRRDVYITKHVKLDHDLDRVYMELMNFAAAGGGDTPESVNQALHEAVTKIKWSPEKSVYKVLFLVGDCPPHMDYKDDVKYDTTCKLAAEKNITINTIQCGNHASTTPIWKEIAKKAEGQFFKVDQSGSAVLTTTPFDSELAELSKQFDQTRVYYGPKEEQDKQLTRVSSAKRIYDEASVSAVAQRAVFNSSKSGLGNFIGANELINDYDNGKVDLEKLEKDVLNDELKKMSKDQLVEYVKEQSDKRKEIAKKIDELSKKRQEHIDKELKKLSLSNKDNKANLDTLIYECIKSQAAKNGIDYKEGPRY
jgi:hypothetical protein